VPELGEFVTAGHLGGYVAGGDPATVYPELWDWLVDWQGVRSVIDVGCGDGVALRHFEGRGCRVRGIEGVPQEHPAIMRWDYTEGAYIPGEAYDLAWSCEFVEHVEEQYVPNFLATFRCARLVLMTHAEPDQPGHHHVNCRDAAYWQAHLETIGYELDLALTTATRNIAAVNENPWNHYRRSGLAFVKRWMP
jgi:hypothetical protein